jgi:GNAT superfamily N-acetyltransferase
MQIEIQDSRERDAAALTEIRIRSKGHWGYSPETLEAWRPAMQITGEYIRANVVRSIFVDGTLAGFYAIKPGLPPELDHLWLAPEVIGRGVGRAALLDCVQGALARGIGSLRIISDADAEGFYLRHGAQRVGEFFSPVQGRMLPVLELVLPR